MQAREVLLAAKVTILLYPSGSRMVSQMLGSLGFSGNQLMSYYGGGIYKSSHQVNTCVTPPYHPALWGAARRLFGVRASLQDPTTSLIILMARSRIVNVKPLLQALRTRYGARLHEFNGGNDLDKAVALFGRARALVGLPGDAFYLMLFAPRDTAVVEIMPTLASGTALPSYVVQSAFWKLARSLGHEYWRLVETPLNTEGNVNVNIRRLVSVLDRLM